MKKVALLTMALAMAGCSSTTIKNLDAMEPRALLNSDVMPSKAELAGGKPRVVVFEAEDGDIPLAKSARVGSTIASEIEKYLAATNVELVDRKLANKLRKELALAEMHGKAEYQGEQVADFAILGVVSQAAAGAQFTEGKRFVDNKGNTVTIAPSCKYNGDVAGSVRIYKMPSMRPVTTEELSGSTYSSEDVRYSGDCALSQTGAEQFARNAATRAVERMRTNLQNQFAPTGYVIEQRVSKDQVAVKVTLGGKHGIKQGDTVEITNVTRMNNPLTNQTSIETFSLGTARVSNQIGSESAWILVEEEIAEKIRIGQPVRLQFKKGLGDHIGTIRDIVKM
ncbi:hypothetical protein [Pseudomonas sp. RL]|uniref:hypothetical protein n=1 Tax=Pseudomonas sp. RL TaxID=1452718 RepID=UPI000484CE3A|nr:hypothetical protein [Pseudomonas sp. RL]